MIDYATITNKYIDIARVAVGSRLSTTGTTTPFPSVILAKQSKQLPDYPFITVDVISTTQTNGWLKDSGILPNEDHYYDTDYTLNIQYTVHGDEALSIANGLEGYFRIAEVRDSIRSKTTGALVSTTPVISVPNTLPTRIKEAALFNLTHSVTDRVIYSGHVFGRATTKQI